ncbi:hypothetical protein R3P38DRAFT_2797132 [Favolaschia claudopus]|uniref:Uncharacterized protein n=1 Tax=Favolaschia claudopus TaxID=2862362 RepID=A0AAW0A3I1_9AGAR
MAEAQTEAFAEPMLIARSLRKLIKYQFRILINEIEPCEPQGNCRRSFFSSDYLTNSANRRHYNANDPKARKNHTTKMDTGTTAKNTYAVLPAEATGRGLGDFPEPFDRGSEDFGGGFGGGSEGFDRGFDGGSEGFIKGNENKTQHIPLHCADRQFRTHRVKKCANTPIEHVKQKNIDPVGGQALYK